MSVTAVDAFAAELDGCGALVSNAGGAIGTETVATGDPQDRRTM